ncbi:MAG: hypothetical protein AAB445_00420 [Patescibacteria group bacterium]
MEAQIIGAIVCWLAVFIIAWILEYNRYYTTHCTQETGFFLWLAGVAASMFGMMLSLANQAGMVGTAVLAFMLAIASWRSHSFREYMRTVLLIAIPGAVVGAITSVPMLFLR